MHGLIKELDSLVVEGHIAIHHIPSLGSTKGLIAGSAFHDGCAGVALRVAVGIDIGNDRYLGGSDGDVGSGHRGDGVGMVTIIGKRYSLVV